MTYPVYGHPRGQFDHRAQPTNHASSANQPQPTGYQPQPTGYQSQSWNGLQPGAPDAWSPRPRLPENPLLYEPLGFFERAIINPECSFVIVGDPVTIHAMIADTYRQVGLRIRFNGDRYKPKKTQLMTGQTGSATKAVLDPTPGMLHTHGVITTGWARRPNNYIVMSVIQNTSSFGASDDMSTGLLPRFCLGLYSLFVQYRMLVWAGEMGSGLNKWGDLATWPTAPGSPTPRAPYEVTEDGLRAAQARGWRGTLL